MSKFIVLGGHKLSGEVKVQGSKNAAFPVIAACVLSEGTCRIKNVPEISDVFHFLEILKYLGAAYEFSDHELIINTQNLQNRDLPPEFMGKLRGSIVMVGAILGRFGKVRFAFPGGDAIGRRPIDQHLTGFRKLGARVEERRGGIFDITAPRLTGSKIVLGFTTVTGTENLILAAVRAHGVSEIRLAAAERHVQSLCRFLNTLGAKIQGLGTPNLKITGVRSLGAGEFTLNPDEVAAMTYCVAGAATKGQVKVRGIEPQSLDAPLAVLERMGVNFETGPDFVEVRAPLGSAYDATKITTGVYPQLLTDYQPLFGVLATKARGETMIHDWIYEGRQGYLRSLQEMGARVEFDDLHHSKIKGPVELHGAEIRMPDIRAGASILIAALIAKGQSMIYNAEMIDRGYERIDERLRGLGAEIERVE